MRREVQPDSSKCWDTYKLFSQCFDEEIHGRVVRIRVPQIALQQCIERIEETHSGSVRVVSRPVMKIIREVEDGCGNSIAVSRDTDGSMYLEFRS